MTLKLVEIEHKVAGFEDQVELTFVNDPLPGTLILPIGRVHPEAATALRAHLTGFTAEPVNYRIIGLSAQVGDFHLPPSPEYDLITERVFVTLDRCSPMSAEQLPLRSAMHRRWVSDILGAFA